MKVFSKKKSLLSSFRKRNKLFFHDVIYLWGTTLFGHRCLSVYIPSQQLSQKYRRNPSWKHPDIRIFCRSRRESAELKPLYTQASAWLLIKHPSFFSGLAHLIYHSVCLSRLDPLMFRTFQVPQVLLQSHGIFLRRSEANHCNKWAC